MIQLMNDTGIIIIQLSDDIGMVMIQLRNDAGIMIQLSNDNDSTQE